jgi:hypothetical protein
MLRFGSLSVKARLYILNGWTTTKRDRGDDTEFVSKWKRVDDFHFEAQIHALRQEFFDIKTADDALKFFERFGPYRINATIPGQVGAAEDISLTRIRRLQDVYSSQLLSDPKEWRTQLLFGYESKEVTARTFAFFEMNMLRSPSFTLEMGYVKDAQGRQEPAPFLNLISKDVADALWASVYLEKMMGLSGRICEHCKKAYIVPNRHGGKYCTPECGQNFRTMKSRNAKKDRLKNG